jgi:hypothetical protein
LPLDMASDFEKWVLEETLTAEIANCLVYEAFKKIENAAKTNPYPNVFDAFLTIGRVKAILGDRFEEVRLRLYQKAKNELLAPIFSEVELKNAAESGLRCGEWRSLPVKIRKQSIHYGFVAEMVCMEVGRLIRYVTGDGWEVWEDRAWRKWPGKSGIIGLIYEAMRRKINIWRETLDGFGGIEGWLIELEKNISDPEWLSKVEELLLRADYFGVQIVIDVN